MNRSYYTALIGKLAIISGIDYENDPRLNNPDRELIREGVRELQFYGEFDYFSAGGPGEAGGSVEKDGQVAAGPVGQPARKGRKPS